MKRWIFPALGVVLMAASAMVYVAVGGTDSSVPTGPTATTGAGPTAEPEATEGYGVKFDPRVPVCGQGNNVKFCVKGQAALDLNEAMLVFEKSGPAAALKILETKLAEGAAWVKECHQMIHIIGHEAARLYPIRDVVDVDNRMCQDGYLDGAMEGFADYTNENEFWAGIKTMCSPMMDEGDMWKATSCAHSVGHAIAFRGVGNYRDAVKYCDVLHPSLQDACGGGAVMGIVNPVEGSAVSDLGLPKYSTLDPEVIDETCTDIPLVYAKPCLSILWTMYPDDWSAEKLLGRLLDLCPRSLDEDRCFDGYGSALYQKNLQTVDERGETAEDVYAAAYPLLQECYGLPKNGVGACVQGVTYSAIWWYTTVRSTAAGYRSMCEDVPVNWRDRCLGAEREVRSGYSEETTKEPGSGSDQL